MRWMLLRARGESERLAGNELADQEDGVATLISEKEGETRNDITRPAPAPAHSNTSGDEKV